MVQQGCLSCQSVALVPSSKKQQDSQCVRFLAIIPSAENAHTTQSSAILRVQRVRASRQLDTTKGYPGLCLSPQHSAHHRLREPRPSAHRYRETRASAGLECPPRERTGLSSQTSRHRDQSQALTRSASPSLSRREPRGRASSDRRPRPAKRTIPLAAEGGGGGSGGAGSGKGYGGGGDGGGNGKGNGGGREEGEGEGHGKGKERPIGLPAQVVQLITEGWTARASADPEFGFKLAVECFNDAMIILAVNAANRRSRFFKEIEFVICHIAVSLLNDIGLVWMLAPIAGQSGSAAGGSFLASLPQHCFQAGAFSLQQRLGALVYKAGLYSCMGLVMGMLGTAIVQGLTSVREKVDPEFVPPAEMQPIVKSGLVWAVYMGVTSNLRYQVVNGLERLLYGSLPSSLARSLTVGMRLGNNFLGSMIFVWMAKVAKLSQPRPVKSRAPGQSPSLPVPQAVAA